MYLKTIAKLPKFESVAWNFGKDGPLKEEIPVKCHVKEEILSNIFDNNFSKEEISKIKNLSKSNPTRHLGLTSDLYGNTEKSCSKQLIKLKDRVREIKLEKIKERPQKYCVNSLVIPMISFAPLQFGYNIDDLVKCDNFILDRIGKNKGFSKNDARHSLFLSCNNLGLEIRSLIATQNFLLCASLYTFSYPSNDKIPPFI